MGPVSDATGGAGGSEGSAGAKFELTEEACCAVLDGSIGDAGFEAAGGCGSDALEGCETGSTGELVVVVCAGWEVVLGA
jgi:hypothetical protein